MIHCKPVSLTVDLGGIARGLLPPGVGIDTRDPRRQTETLHPAESVALTKMVPARRREYTAGRLAAKGAMAAAGLPTNPVTMGQDRAPIWPRGIVGSISHSTDHCIALAARKADFRSLSVDLEPELPLEDALLDLILMTPEKLWLQTQPEHSRSLLARLIFSAKECAYKCQYPLTGQLFGFDGLQIVLDQGKHSFTARFTRTTGIFAQNDLLQGRYYMGQGIILTTMTLNSPPALREEE